MFAGWRPTRPGWKAPVTRRNRRSRVGEVVKKTVARRLRWCELSLHGSVSLSKQSVPPWIGSPLERITDEYQAMVTVPDHDLPARIRAANADSATDTRWFSLIDELAERENHRDALLDRMLIDESDVIEAAAKKACDVARAVYERIAAIKPTTRAGVLCQLELAATGWVSSWTVPMAIAALREIGDR